MSDQAAAAAIQAAGNATASAVTNSGNKRSQERANRMNVEFWNMQNDYNNPTAQMSRLREAGLNPNLIYGTSPSSAVGNAEGIAPSKASEYNFENPLREINSIANLQQTGAQTDNLRSQNTVLAQEAVLKAGQTAKLGIDTAKTKLDYDLSKELFNTSADAARENLRKLKADTLQSELDGRFKDKSLKDRLMDINFKMQNARDQLPIQKQVLIEKQLDNELRQLGLQPSDPYYIRVLGRKGGPIRQGLEGLPNQQEWTPEFKTQELNTAKKYHQ